MATGGTSQWARNPQHKAWSLRAWRVATGAGAETWAPEAPLGAPPRTATVPRALKATAGPPTPEVGAALTEEATRHFGGCFSWTQERERPITPGNRGEALLSPDRTCIPADPAHGGLGARAETTSSRDATTYRPSAAPQRNLSSFREHTL